MKIVKQKLESLGIIALVVSMMAITIQASADDRRGQLEQWWVPKQPFALTSITVGTADGNGPFAVKSDGVDIWVANRVGVGSVQRIRARDHQLLQTWKPITGASALVIVDGKVYVVGFSATNSSLYALDPTACLDPVCGTPPLVTNQLGSNSMSITFDGSRFWVANAAFPPASSSVSIVSLNPTQVTTVTTGFSEVRGIIFDGTSIWVTDEGTGNLDRLDNNAAIVQTVPAGISPRFPVYDGQNIWVPDQSGNLVTVVQASTGTVVATLTGNGLNEPFGAAYDGARVLITNFGGSSASVFRASDLSPLGSTPLGTTGGPLQATSDALHFWITVHDTAELIRF